MKVRVELGLERLDLLEAVVGRSLEGGNVGGEEAAQRAGVGTGECPGAWQWMDSQRWAAGSEKRGDRRVCIPVRAAMLLTIMLCALVVQSQACQNLAAGGRTPSPVTR